MNIRLSPEQIAWLESKVAAGQFLSLEEAAAAAISDLAWARPLVDAARASVESGQFRTHAEFKQFLVGEQQT